MSYYYVIDQKKVNNQYNINNLKTGQYNTISIILTPIIDNTIINTIILLMSDKYYNVFFGLHGDGPLIINVNVSLPYSLTW